MSVRTSRTLLAQPQRSGALVYNFMRKSAVECSAGLLEAIAQLEDWVESDVAKAELERFSGEDGGFLLDHLIDLGLVVESVSEWGRIDEEYASKWEWGLSSAALHFSTQNAAFMTLEQSAGEQGARLQSEAPPAIALLPTGGTKLAPSCSGTVGSLLDLMASRRTNRVTDRAAIDVQQLVDCLYAGLGVTGAVMTSSGPQPLKMTPSGGARNPYEAYVVANNVNGLAAGLYHYCALDNSLSLVRVGKIEQPSQMLAGQDWADAMPAIIILVAYLERTMWKYQDANAYRVVMIEAGHIGQNIMLAATAHRLAACPTAALHHATISDCLGLNGILQTPVYALTLSAPGLYDGMVMTTAALLESLAPAAPARELDAPGGL